MKDAKPKSVTIPLKLPPDLEKRVKHIARKAHLSAADVMRLAMIHDGLDGLEKMFKVAA